MRRDESSIGGFTLVELLLALAIMAVITGFGLFAGMDMYRDSLIHSESDTLETALRRARSQSMSGRGGVAHGVCRDESRRVYELYAGAPDGSYAELPSSAAVFVSGVPACKDGGIAFSAYAGTSTGARIIVAEEGAERTITVNHEGWIDAED